VELTVDEAALNARPPDTAALRELYTRLEMRSFLRALDGGEGAASGAAGAPTPAAAAALPQPLPAALQPCRTDDWRRSARASVHADR
jgi:hypothetical protein